MRWRAVCGGASTCASTNAARGRRVVAWFMNRRSRLSGIATGDQAMFMRRDVFERLGGFAAIPLMEDIEMSRRLKALGPPACLEARRRDLGPALGAPWPAAHDLADVAAARGLLLRRRSGATRQPLHRHALIVARILVFAKAPLAGRVKTRLSPALDGEGCGPAPPAHGAAYAERRLRGRARQGRTALQSVARAPVLRRLRGSP